MLPHGFGGLTWGEWVSIIAIITFVSTIISLLFRYAVFGPLQNDIKELSITIGLLNDNLAELHANYAALDARVDEHDRRLDRHHEQIKNLYNRGEGK